MKQIYLDNSATTKPCEEAVEATVRSMREDFANPSSLYSAGLEAHRLMEKSREGIAEFLGCQADEVYFTSGGTEANNIALQGAFYANLRRGNRVVTTAFEHPSVINTLRELCLKNSVELIEIKPDKSGNISENDIFDAIDENTFLVSVMLVNNETGAVNPVSAARRAIKQKLSPALLHSDCVQAFGKIAFSPKSLGADLVSISGHKVHAPKGVGALYVKKGVRLAPLIFGGGQEKNIRPGTQSTALIEAFSAAVGAIGNVEDNLRNIKELNDYAREKLLKIEEVKINSPDDALPYVLNISVLGYRSEVMLRVLSAKGVFVSSGSACAKGKRSYVLSSMGLDGRRIDSAQRISFSRFSQKGDVDALVSAIEEGRKTVLKSK